MKNLHSWIKYLLRIVGSLSIPSNYVSIFHVFSYSFHKNMYFMLMRCHMRRYKKLQNGKSAKTFTEDQITFLKNLFFGILLNRNSFLKELTKTVATHTKNDHHSSWWYLQSAISIISAVFSWLQFVDLVIFPCRCSSKNKWSYCMELSRSSSW